jgi:predicted pyridoxine 5'-phosphate oxidase superfamily flavin-nucleotide-binding protein
MSIMYHEGNRQLQDRFDSRRISDRLEEKLTRTAFSDDDKTFIESVPYFFLATADAQGRPDCSFKGGMPGFVRVTGLSEIAFPDYDGNGMFKSLGNLLVNPNVGLLFIAMHDKPKRLRVNGEARISDADPLLGTTADRARGGARHLPQLPALYPANADDRAVGLHTTAEMRAARAGVERLRQLQGRGASARADVQGLVFRRPESVYFSPAMHSAAPALTQQFLAWVDEAPRSYADAEAWRRSCPHLSIWEDAISDGLVRFENGAGMQGSRLTLTPRGRALLKQRG